MRHRKRRGKLGRVSSHRQALLRNLACALFEYGRIKTTEPKGKELRKMAEQLITLAKKGNLHARRKVISALHNPEVTAKLFKDIAPLYAGKSGGYTRLIRLGRRRGDGALEALVELVKE